MALAVAPSNLDDLFVGVGNVFADLRNSTIAPLVAKEMNNSAGKMVNIVKCKLEACALTKTEPDFPQLGKFMKGAKK